MKRLNLTAIENVFCLEEEVIPEGNESESKHWDEWEKGENDFTGATPDEDR